MKIKLNKIIFDYLNDKFFTNNPKIKKRITIILEKENYIIFEIDENDADSIREWALDYLQEVGFDKEYELTKEGQIIEDIIDLFYIR